MSRVIHFQYSPEASTLQEALLERTDALLQDLCTVFDDAKSTFDTATAGVGGVASDIDVAIQKMMGAATYATKNVLAQSPSVKYALMFTRVQDIFARMNVIRDAMGPDAVHTIEHFMTPIWSVLKTIDDAFSKEHP